MSILITNIGELMTQDLEQQVRRNAAVVLDGERIRWIGDAAAAPAADTAFDAQGRACAGVGRLALAPGVRR